MKNIILIAIAITCLNGCAHHTTKVSDGKSVVGKSVVHSR